METGTTVLHSLHIFNTLDDQKKNTISTLHVNSISCPQWIYYTLNQLSTKLATLKKNVRVVSLIKHRRIVKYI